MSEVRYIKHESRLAKLVKTPGGKTLDAAVQDADEALGSIKGACSAEVDGAIAILAAAVTYGAMQNDCDRLYNHARNIAGLASLCQRPDIGEVAHSLCVLLDASREAGWWRPQAVAIHISTLQHLRELIEDVDPAIRDMIITDLQVMVRKLIQEGQPPFKSAVSA